MMRMVWACNAVLRHAMHCVIINVAGEYLRCHGVKRCGYQTLPAGIYEAQSARSLIKA